MNTKIVVLVLYSLLFPFLNCSARPSKEEAELLCRYENPRMHVARDLQGGVSFDSPFEDVFSQPARGMRNPYGFLPRLSTWPVSDFVCTSCNEDEDSKKRTEERRSYVLQLLSLAESLKSKKPEYTHKDWDYYQSKLNKLKK